jgi:ParB family chromosome partitioning protein
LTENEVRKDFTPSERHAIAKALEQEIGKRQGQRTDLEHSRNCGEVAGRTEDIVAERAGASVKGKSA